MILTRNSSELIDRLPGVQLNPQNIPLLLKESQLAIADFKAKIKEQRTLQAYLKGCSNASLSNVGRLPVEILGDIFLEVVRSWFWSFVQGNTNYSYPWRVLSQVCRHWREVVRSYPQLFSYIAFRLVDGLGHIEEVRKMRHLDYQLLHLLEISQEVPLHLYISTTIPMWGTQALTKLPFHIHRAKTLIVQSLAPSEGHFWPHSPDLTSLAIDFDQSPLIEEEWIIAVLRASPNLRVFQCSALSLSKGVDWDWTKYPLASTLTKLSIAHTTPFVTSASLQGLFKTLQTFTHLRELELRLLSPGDYALDKSLPAPKPLRFIECLKLHGHWMPVFTIIDGFRAVNRILVELTKSQGNPNWETVRALPRVLSSKLPKNLPSYRTARLSVINCSPRFYRHNDWIFTLECWSRDETSVYLSSVCNVEPDFKMAFVLDEVASNTADSCKTVGLMLSDLARLRSEIDTILIHTDVTHQLGQAFDDLWVTVLFCFKNAQKMRITYNITKGYGPDTHGLTPRIDTFVANQLEGELWYPSLRRLRVTVLGEGKVNWFLPSMFNELYFSLQHRWEHGRAMHLLLLDTETVDCAWDLREQLEFGRTFHPLRQYVGVFHISQDWIESRSNLSLIFSSPTHSNVQLE